MNYRPTPTERRAEKRLAAILASRAAHRNRTRLVEFTDLMLDGSAQFVQAEAAMELLHNRAVILRHLSRGSINVAAEVTRLLRPRTYCFECNTSRWLDGLFRLVDRGYEPIHGVALSREELDKLGWLGWHDTRWRQVATGDSIICVIDDEFGMSCTPPGLQFLADLLDDTGDYIIAAARAIAEAEAGSAA